MISQICGVIENYSDNTLELKVGGFAYEVMIPTAVVKSLGDKLTPGNALDLVTFHYYQTDPSKSFPVLIGFANRVEKDFFEKFITVSGVGPKAAVRALSLPIPQIAQAIDAGDLKFLKSLPGIGEQRAKEIIAKLQGKMGKYSLMRTADGSVPGTASVKHSAVDDVYREAVDVLIQLQYKRDEAMTMIDKAIARKSGMKDVEEILNEVYRQRKVNGS